MVKLEELGLTVKKVRKEVVKNQDVGGQDAARTRAIRWEEIRKEEILEQKKAQELYNVIIKTQLEEQQKAQQDKATIMRNQIDYILSHTMSDGAKRMAGWMINTEPRCWYIFVMNIFPPVTYLDRELSRRVGIIDRTLKGGNPEQLISITLEDLKTAYALIKQELDNADKQKNVGNNEKLAKKAFQE